jgi:hypothetical protein
LTVPSLYILVTLCFIKQMRDNLERNLQKYEYHTRGKNKLYIRACKTALFQNNVLRIRLLENCRSFKKEVKLLLISNTFYSVDEFLNSNLY